MLEGFRSRLTFANVASALALFMAIGGGGVVAVGAIGGGDGTIKACYVKKGNARKGTSTGEVQLLLKGKKCDKGEKAFSFNARGGQGLPGANGSARAYGRVSGQGVVDPARSTPGVTVVRLAEGQYCVTVPGLTQANAVIVPVMEFSDVDSLGGDTANARQFGFCNPNLSVETWNPDGTARDDAGFTFVIP